MNFTITSKPGMTPYAIMETPTEALMASQEARKLGLDGCIYILEADIPVSCDPSILNPCEVQVRPGHVVACYHCSEDVVYRDLDALAEDHCWPEGCY